MVTVRPALLFLLLAGVLDAHAAILGTELPLAPPQSIPAPFEQGAPDVASNGTQALAVWLDARGSAPLMPRTFSAYATLLDEHGQPLAPAGIEVAHDAYAVKVATSGPEFLVVYGSGADDRVYAVHTTDGTPSAPPVFLDSGTVIGLASNGDTYCAILADFNDTQYRALILDRDGWPLVTVPLADAIDAVIATGENYLAVGSSAQCDGCARNVTTTRISESGSIAHNVIVSNRPSALRTAAAAGDNGALVAWTLESADDGRVTEAVTIDADGRKKGSTQTIHTTEEIAFAGSGLAPSVAFDGARYLVGFAESPVEAPLQSYYLVARVSESGEPLDDYPVALSSAMDDGFVAAEVSRDMLLLWSEHGDLYARTMNSFLSIDESPEPDVVVARASDVQSETSLAVAGNTGFAAWVEGESANKIMATFFTPPADPSATELAMQPITLAGYGDVTYAAPSVAAAGDRFIAMWRESFDGEARIYAQRWSAGGTKIDAEPLLLDATSGSAYDFMTDTAVASEGTSFFAVWRHGGELWGAIIPRSGDARSAFRVSRTAANEHARVSPSIAWTGSMYLVVWQHAAGATHALELARVTADGTLLDTTSSPAIATTSAGADAVSMAMGASNALAVYRDGGCVQGVLLSTDGQVISTLTPFDCGAAADDARNDVAVTWLNDAFTTAWSRGTLEAARIADSGAVVERFTFAGDAWSPALLPGLAAYAHVSGNGTGRIVLRTFKGGGKRRAATH